MAHSLVMFLNEISLVQLYYKSSWNLPGKCARNRHIFTNYGRKSQLVQVLWL